ncbi:N-acylneuraminate cytidylyltransferase [Blastochloris viridis]|uniref:N-acylneuraminate cytidylyltransferase n=1 Tax=Blastochloris viridis TaxID=1079 RepID=A0A0S4Q1L1_BLAVI|nr:N-acylneuraminate cytidylyltransferase [Blastochloris viridis]
MPARSGSKRVPHKNIRVLNGHPVLAYTICAARASGVFDSVIVSTDSELYADIARHYGAEVPFLRPAEIAGDRSPDIEWVRLTIERLEQAGRSFDAFSILRPTSPFRKPQTIRRAWDRFLGAEGIDSLRAVEWVEQHPGKMWVVRGDRLLPLLPLSPDDAPWHSQQMAALPAVYVQNASLEIAWTRVVRASTISGTVMLPFFTEADEGLDINRSKDLWYAELLIKTGEALLPEVDRDPYPIDRLSVDA